MEVVSKSNTRVPLWLKQNYIHTKLKPYDGFSSTQCIFVFLYVLYGKQKKKLENKVQLWFQCTIQPRSPFFCQHILQENNRQCKSLVAV